MERLLLFVMSCLYFCILSGQTLTDQIEHAYSSLDSVSYIDDIILSYGKQKDKRMQESFRSVVRMRSKDKDSSDVCKQNISMYLKYFADCEISVARGIKSFESDVKFRTPVYVLNLKLKDDRTLQVDTGRLAFNLFISTRNTKVVYTYIVMTENIAGKIAILELFHRELGISNYSANVFQSLLGINFTFGRYA